MLRGGVETGPLVRALAVAGAVVLHALALFLAAAALERRPPPEVAAERLRAIHFFITQRAPPAAAEAAGAAPGPVAKRRRHREPAPVAAFDAPDHLAIDVREDEGAPPNMPPMVIDEGRRESPGEEALGDSGRRAPGARPRRDWLVFGFGGPGVMTAPAPSRFCVPRAPRMPEVARAQGLVGTVEAVFEVDADGVVTETSLSGATILTEAVRAWLRGCLFEPSLQDGRPAPARVKQQFRFELK